MIWYHVELETGSAYKSGMFETYDEALAYYNKHFDDWEYASIQSREMNPIDLSDIYTTLMEKSYA